MGHIVALLELLLFSKKNPFFKLYHFIGVCLNSRVLKTQTLAFEVTKFRFLFFFKSKGIEAVIETDDK